MSKKAYLTVTIDTECDKRPDWRNSDPLTFNSIIHGIPNILQPLFRKYGVIPTYLLSPEVLENTQCIEVLKSVEKECELGTHLHADFIEPQKRYSDFSGKMCNDFQTDYAEDIEFLKLSNLTSLFKDKFSKSPHVFRAGRYSANKNTINSLIKLGYKVDTSFTPHVNWESPKGNMIFHENVPEQPYFMDQNNLYTTSCRREFLEVPISIIGIKKYCFLDKYAWLRPKFSSYKWIKKIIKKIIQKNIGNEIIVLNMMFHSMEVIPGASPYSKNENDVKYYTRTLEKTFQFCRKMGITFCTLEDLFKMYSI